MNIDQLVRDTLQRRVGAAPSGAGLLTGVQARSRRYRQRRRLTVAGAALAAVALAVGTVAMVRPEPTATTTPIGATPPPAATAGSETLVPPSYELPEVPVSFAAVPAGYADPRYEHIAADYTGFRSNQPGTANAYLSVQVSDADPGREWFDAIAFGTAQEPVTVRGRDGVLRTGRTDGDGADTRITAVSWPEATGQWITVLGNNGPAPAEVVRVAEELQPVPFPAGAPFRFALVPAGVEPTHASPGRMTFQPAGSDPDAGHLFVSLATSDSSYIECLKDGVSQADCPEPTREQLRVGGREAELIEEPQLESRTLIVTLAADRQLWVTSRGELELSREDLIQFTQGVEIVSDDLPNP